MMPIQILLETVAAQIAAGEVVERPASVVKELVENALDANASAITVEVRQGGRRLIRVSDDGSGIPAAEVPIAFHRHSTSKLNSASDLRAIETLGFRGEALASIASVAQITMVTRGRGETAGSRLRIEGGRVLAQETVGAPQGTVVGVENLFYNVPARLKFLRTVATEKRHIDALVTRYAMAYPAVRFRLIHDGRQVFSSPGSGKLKEVLIEVFGLGAAKQMLEIEGWKVEGGGWKMEDGGWKVEVGRWEVDDPTSNLQPPISNPQPPTPNIHVHGYTSAPSLSRSNRTQITLFVNGRWVQDQGLTYAVVRAYHTLLMTGRYPLAVIMVHLPAGEVDVNVHPAKAEVRFREREAVFSAVQRAVRRTLLDSSPAARPADLAGSESGGWMVVAKPATRLQLEMDLPGATAGQRHDPDLPISQSTNSPISMLRPIGQVGAAYIVAEGPAGMVVLDQHAAHERVLYEQFMAQRDKGVVTQTLLEAEPVELSPDRAALLGEQLALLAGLGFLVEHFGGTTFMLRGLPAVLGEISPTAALEAVTDDLERGDKPLEGSIEEQIIARVCKTAAVKAGQVLTGQEMSAMIRQLEACESPYTCPHGRPTMIQMSAEQLARQFGRL